MILERPHPCANRASETGVDTAHVSRVPGGVSKFATDCMFVGEDRTPIAILQNYDELTRALFTDMVLCKGTSHGYAERARWTLSGLVCCHKDKPTGVQAWRWGLLAGVVGQLSLKADQRRQFLDDPGRSHADDSASKPTKFRVWGWERALVPSVDIEVSHTCGGGHHPNLAVTSARTGSGGTAHQKHQSGSTVWRLCQCLMHWFRPHIGHRPRSLLPCVPQALLGGGAHGDLGKANMATGRVQKTEDRRGPGKGSQTKDGLCSVPGSSFSMFPCRG